MTWRAISARPYLNGLGMPGVLCPAVGLLERSTELTITCPGASGATGADRLRIEDKTRMSKLNVTEVSLDGAEVETATKTGRKRFMLSGAVDAAQAGAGAGGATAVVRCRLFQRGPGWETRQERCLADPPGSRGGAAQGARARAEGEGEGEAAGGTGTMLRERNVLVRPGQEDIVVDRYFTRVAAAAEAVPPAAADTSKTSS